MRASYGVSIVKTRKPEELFWIHTTVISGLKSNVFASKSDLISIFVNPVKYLILCYLWRCYNGTLLYRFVSLLMLCLGHQCWVFGSIFCHIPLIVMCIKTQYIYKLNHVVLWLFIGISFLCQLLCFLCKFIQIDIHWNLSEKTGGLNTLRPRQNGRHFADDRFKCILLNENLWITIKHSLKFVSKDLINNIPALVQIMAWRRPGDKPLSEPMLVSLPTHICVTRSQWVKY